MADLLVPRLNRLEELAKQVNAASDETGRQFQRVEAHLNKVIHLGVTAEVLIDSSSLPEEFYESRTWLVYGRYGPKFRIYVRETLHQLDSQTCEETLWSNCSRDVKLLAFNYLPSLLEELERSLECTLEQIKSNSEALQSLLPPPKGKAAKS
jgi:hypothetical protein